MSDFRYCEGGGLGEREGGRRVLSAEKKRAEWDSAEWNTFSISFSQLLHQSISLQMRAKRMVRGCENCFPGLTDLSGPACLTAT